MNFGKTIAALMIAAALQNPCAVNAADEDRELSLIAAEQENTGDEKLDELNPALTETISTERKEDTDKERRERRKKLRETRREKERENERKLRDSTRKKDAQMETESPIVIDPSAPEPEPTPEPVAEPEPVAQPEPIKKPEPQPVTKPEPEPTPEPVAEPESIKKPEPKPVTKPVIEPSQFTEPITEENKIPKPSITPPATETFTGPNPKEVYANFAEVSRALGFIPLYMPRKSGYEIIAIYAEPGIVEMQYGRRWEPEVGVAIRTYKRAEGEELRDISGVDGVKWRVDTTTGTTIYLAKISDNEQVAAWAVGHYTFSAHSKNLSFAGFHALVADELVELSTHYYLDL
ncbi:MAG: hypothetical protein IJ685_03370 [Selenomonadaceae bacterium]|nr:hypothetical protein [Selenomonadaceae bacterium]